MKTLSKKFKKPEDLLFCHDRKFKATSADILEVILNGDYGADPAVLSEEHLKGLSRHGKFIPILQLETLQDLQLTVLSQNYSLVRTLDLSPGFTCESQFNCKGTHVALKRFQVLQNFPNLRYTLACCVNIVSTNQT